MTRSKLDRKVGNSITVEVAFQQVLSLVEAELSRRSAKVGLAYEVAVFYGHAPQIDLVTASSETYD